MFHISNSDDYNHLPPAKERRGLWWSWVGPALGLQAPPAEDVHPAILKMRRYQAALEAANAPPVPPSPTVLDTVRDVVAEIVEAVKPTSAREKATAWLLEQLAHGPVAAVDIEESCRADGHALKTVRRAGKDIGVKPIRSGNAWWWSLPGQLDGRAG